MKKNSVGWEQGFSFPSIKVIYRDTKYQWWDGDVGVRRLLSRVKKRPAFEEVEDRIVWLSLDVVERKRTCVESLGLFRRSMKRLKPRRVTLILVSIIKRKEFFIRTLSQQWEQEQQLEPQKNEYDMQKKKSGEPMFFL